MIINEKETYEFEIIKETDKAKLIKIGDISFWVMNRWVRSDYTLTPAAKKAYEKRIDDILKRDEEALKRAKEREEMDGYRVWMKEFPHYYTQDRRVDSFCRIYDKEGNYGRITFSLDKKNSDHCEHVFKAWVSLGTLKCDLMTALNHARRGLSDSIKLGIITSINPSFPRSK